MEDCPLQEKENAPVATVTIYPEFSAAAGNIVAGAKIWLFTWLHLANRQVLTCIPRKNYGAPQLGVFSTRSPDRPNPIGMHQVTVLAVEDNGTLQVAALEVLDQTPVIDIKPVI